MTDTELLTRFIDERDRSALTQLVLRYERLVWSVCHRTLRNRADVEDAFQTTFLTLAKQAHRIRKKESLSHWLYGVARRTSLKIRSGRAISLIGDVMDDPGQIVDPASSELEEVARQYEIDLVDQQLNAMPEKYRTPLILKYFCGLSAKQIADQINLSTAAIEGRLRRGRGLLKESLQRSQPALAPALALPVLSKFCSQPDLVSATAEQCFATCWSAMVAGQTQTVTLGAKLMICKIACCAGISGLLAIGSIFHAGLLNSSTPTQSVSMQQSRLDSESSPVSLTPSGQACCDQTSDCCDICPPGCCDDVGSCCEDCKPCEQVCEAIHAHIGFAHSMIGQHLSQLCKLFGLCGDDCCVSGCCG